MVYLIIGSWYLLSCLLLFNHTLYLPPFAPGLRGVSYIYIRTGPPLRPWLQGSPIHLYKDTGVPFVPGYGDPTYKYIIQRKRPVTLTPPGLQGPSIQLYNQTCGTSGYTTFRSPHTIKTSYTGYPYALGLQGPPHTIIHTYRWYLRPRATVPPSIQ